MKYSKLRKQHRNLVFVILFAGSIPKTATGLLHGDGCCLGGDFHQSRYRARISAYRFIHVVFLIWIFALVFFSGFLDVHIAVMARIWIWVNLSG